MVDAAGDVGSYCAAVADGFNVFFSYYDATNKALKYGEYDGATWELETVDSEDGMEVGLFSDIDVDGSNNAHISYASRDAAGNVRLRYATNEGGSWSIEVVDEDAK
ncbi:MAG: hypothetical protein M5R36_07410 [Deltaproteobacteria bacterium]|nr:hypothetical protein [Deltaproteobacteria bacterium]